MKDKRTITHRSSSTKPILSENNGIERMKFAIRFIYSVKPGVNPSSSNNTEKTFNTFNAFIDNDEKRLHLTSEI